MSKKLGNLIKEARTEKGLTQAALAEKTGGITSSDVSKIERGEKEPEQEILKKMAKVLGVTQKSLLEAASGKTSTSTSGKTGTAGKTGSSGKTASSGKKPSSSSKKTSSSDPLTLTATEKKLVQLYRKADSSTKKAAMNLLKGENNALELIGSMLTSNKDVSDMASGLFGSLLSGKREIPGDQEIPEDQ
ncbi:MAG: helix-turn-helix domain-containing protein [Eubacteriales bacterium]|nr:helix-turn-helix domain-containing protein [Eubacteriales bacterium]